jgi:peptidoglycan/xylan/chitin deacetylase (PgdA/CDA1 family)
MREQRRDIAVTTSSVRSVPVLMYHEISEPAKATWSGIAVSPAAFREQLGYLRDAGYTTLSAGGLAALLATQGQVPPRTVILTFDDGFEDFHRHAVPALAERGLAATVFVTTGWIQDAGPGSAAHRPGPMLSWSQVAEVVAAGMEVGAHSCQHPQLDQIPAALLREELYTSKARLEDRLGIPVPGLAYPYGYSNAAVREVARAAGYGYGYGVRNTMAAPGADLFRLPRLTIHRSTSLPEFRRLVEGQLALTMMRDRALTATWSVVRRSRAALTASSSRDYAAGS